MLKEFKKIWWYDPTTGKFYWKINTSGGPGRKRIMYGTVVGTKRKNGYVQLAFGGKRYRANRVVWLFMTGEWPPKNQQVEHRDSNKSNNRWDNLYLVTGTKNRQNLRDPIRKDNKSGFRGVSLRSDGRWLARITVNKRIINLGIFVDPREAADARKAAELAYFPLDRQD